MEILGALLENFLESSFPSWFGSAISWFFFRKTINKKGVLFAFLFSWILYFVIDLLSEFQGNRILAGDDPKLIILLPLGLSLVTFALFSNLKPFSKRNEGNSLKK